MRSRVPSQIRWTKHRTKEELLEELEIDTIIKFRKKGIFYKPKRNFIPDYIRYE